MLSHMHWLVIEMKGDYEVTLAFMGLGVSTARVKNSVLYLLVGLTGPQPPCLSLVSRKLDLRSLYFRNLWT